MPVPVLRAAGGARRLGGGAKRRVLVDCVSFSYSTEVLRGTMVAEEDAPDAQALFGLEFRLGMDAEDDAEGCMLLSSAARMNAFAMLTVVSLTLHLSGLGAPTLGSRCLRRA